MVLSGEGCHAHRGFQFRTAVPACLLACQSVGPSSHSHLTSHFMLTDRLFPSATKLWCPFHQLIHLSLKLPDSQPACLSCPLTNFCRNSEQSGCTRIGPRQPFAFQSHPVVFAPGNDKDCHVLACRFWRQPGLPGPPATGDNSPQLSRRSAHHIKSLIIDPSNSLVWYSVQVQHSTTQHERAQRHAQLLRPFYSLLLK